MEDNLLPQEVVNQVWDYVDKFICPIHFIPQGDDRDPLGDHHGTGWFVENKGKPQLCTCEHVAIYQDRGVLGYAPFGGEEGLSVGSPFLLKPHPLDFAIADISRTWSLIKHKGECIPKDLFSTQHKPVDGEYLYVQGFPGVDSHATFGQHSVKGLSAYLHEVIPPQKLFTEKPPFNTAVHICMAWSPANATPLTEEAYVLSVAGGLSGSLLWNTGYKEAKDENRKWSVNDIKVTGIIWGASSKAGVITATPIEHFSQFIY